MDHLIRDFDTLSGTGSIMGFTQVCNADRQKISRICQLLFLFKNIVVRLDGLGRQCADCTSCLAAQKTRRRGRRMHDMLWRGTSLSQFTPMSSLCLHQLCGSDESKKRIEGSTGISAYNMCLFNV